MTKEARKEMLISNDYNWCVVDYTDGTTRLVHKSGLSNILECGHPKEDYDIVNIETCWNGEDLDY